VEPQRDIAEPDPRAAIMLAGGSDGRRSRGFAASELLNSAFGRIEMRKFAVSELRKFAISESRK
jgi:hypothetical protein